MQAIAQVYIALKLQVSEHLPSEDRMSDLNGLKNQ